MAWLTVDEYANFMKLTRQAIYKQIRQNKIDVSKDEKGVTVIWVDQSQSINQDNFFDHDESQPNDNTDQVHQLREFLKELLMDVNSKHELVYNLLNESKNNEIKEIKDRYKEIIELKDERIGLQQQEIESLKELIKAKDKNLFRKLFG